MLGENLVLASLNARSSSAYTPAQGLHRDHQGQLWYERREDGRYLTAHVYMQSLWVLDDMTPDRGATRIVPGTHTAEAGSPRPGSPYGDPIPLVAPAGAVALLTHPRRPRPARQYRVRRARPYRRWARATHAPSPSTINRTPVGHLAVNTRSA